MLDLDSLADKCAKSLNQKAEAWRVVVWSAAFQKITQSMSDGEVEALLANCASTGHLEVVLRFLDEHPLRQSESPYVILQQEAQKTGLGLRDWISKLPGGLGFNS